MDSLEKCPTCSKQISCNASDCPKCGEPLKAGWVEERQPAQEKANQTVNSGCVIVFVVVCILALIGLALPDEPMTSEQKQDQAIKRLCNAGGGKNCN